jgi:MFS transporter, DHA3 family, macrolide efflux protein
MRGSGTHIAARSQATGSDSLPATLVIRGYSGRQAETSWRGRGRRWHHVTLATGASRPGSAGVRLVARLFRWDRDFGVFFCTQGVSNIGDAAWAVLIPLYVLQLTHDPLQVSAIAVIEVVAFSALQIPLGALADRREGRRLMITADIARTLLTLAIPVTSALHGPTLVVIYIVIAPIEGFSALFVSASGAAVPMLVPADERGKAYAWQESLESMAWVIGPPVAGLLAAAAGTGQAIGLDSASYVVSVAGLVAIRKRFEAVPESAGEGLGKSMKSALRLMIRDRVLRRDQLVWSLYSILGSAIVLGLIYIGTDGGKSHPVLATLAVAAYAAGSAAGTLLAARFEKVPNLWLAVAAGLATTGAGAFLIALRATPAVLAGALLFGLGEGFVLVIHLTLRGKATPEGYFGRITGIAAVLGQITTGLSMLWLGLALRFATGQAAFTVLGAAVLALAVAVAVSPKPVRSAPAGDEGERWPADLTGPTAGQ